MMSFVIMEVCPSMSCTEQQDGKTIWITSAIAISQSLELVYAIVKCFMFIM